MSPSSLVLGMKENKAVVDLKAAAKTVSEMVKKYDMEIDPWAKVEELSVGQQQRLEILKALYRKADLLILDEPTACLTPQEVKSLFNMIRMLTDEGHTVIFISHELAEIMTICDRLTVLRQGRVAATMSMDEVVSKEVELVTQISTATPGAEILRAEEMCCLGENGQMVLDHVSFTLRKGEILGVCGVDGNGQSELVKCITGLYKISEGKCFVAGEDCTNKRPKDILAKKVSHIPEDRHKMGMIKEMNVNENLALMSYDTEPYSKKGILNWNWIYKHSAEICKTYSVKTPDVFEISGNLSGGNQQKFVVGRELDRKPELLIAVHPSRGLDIGATKYVQSKIVEERDRGAGVLMVSTELDEIIELSDRIMVMYDGKIMGIVGHGEASRERLGKMMAGIVEEYSEAT